MNSTGWSGRQEGGDKIFTSELGGRQAAPGLAHNIWSRVVDEVGHKLSGRTAIMGR